MAMPKLKCAELLCQATDMTPGGLYDFNAYNGGNVPEWRCAAHMPKDWVGWPKGRLNPHELLAIHAHVAKNLEALTKQTGGKGS